MKELNLEVLAAKTPLAVFTDKDGLKPIIEDARKLVESFEHDLTTGVGRQRTASLAARVSKLKVKLDDMGRDLVAEWKSNAKLVDNSRKEMRDELDLLKIEARKPLTDWEEEQKRIEAEKTEQEAREKLAKEIEDAHEMAILLNEKIDREIADKKRIEAEEAEKKRIAAELAQEEREDAIRKEAAAQAEAEKQRAIKEKEESELRAKIDRENAEKKAKQEAAEAESKRLRDLELAEQKRIADIETAKREAQEQAERIEKARIEKERQAEAEKQRLAADEAHVRAIKNESFLSLLECGFDREVATKLIVCLADGLVKNIKIQF